MIKSEGIYLPEAPRRDPWSMDVRTPPRAGRTELVAWFSDDHRRRYLLSYWWAKGPRLPWIMLNPSVAGSSLTGDNLDPTLRRVRAFTLAAGFPGFDVVNLYSLIDPFPAGLADEDPALLDEDRGWLADVAHSDTPVVVAWGAHAKAVARAKVVVGQILKPAAAQLRSITVTADGHPGHPGRIANTCTLTAWVPPWP